MTEGYGPSARAMLQLKDEGASLVVTVDCGAAAMAALTAARDAGLDVIVLDHHAVEIAPPAFAQVNPNQPGDTSGLSYLCAAGVTFLFARRAQSRAARSGWYAANNIAEPDLREHARSRRPRDDLRCGAADRRQSRLRARRVSRSSATQRAPALPRSRTIAEDRARRSRPIIWALCSARASMRAGASGDAVSASNLLTAHDGHRGGRIRARARPPQSRAPGDREADPRRRHRDGRTRRTMRRSCSRRTKAGMPASSASLRAA